MAQSLVSRIKVMADMNIVERRRPQDGQIGTEIDGRPSTSACDHVPTIFGEKAVLRLLDKTRGLLSLGELGCPLKPAPPWRARHLAVRDGGVRRTDRQREDDDALRSDRRHRRPEPQYHDDRGPRRVRGPSINQIQVNNQAGVTFADGLRSILRQDPDVILIGEVRDLETSRIAVQSALTGHLVLSSVHATDSATVDPAVP